MEHDSSVDTSYKDGSSPGGCEDPEGHHPLLGVTLCTLAGHSLCHHIKAPGGPERHHPCPRAHLLPCLGQKDAGCPFHPRQGEGTEWCGPQAVMDENRSLGCSTLLQPPADGLRANGLAICSIEESRGVGRNDLRPEHRN